MTPCLLYYKFNPLQYREGLSRKARTGIIILLLLILLLILDTVNQNANDRLGKWWNGIESKQESLFITEQ